MGALPLEKEIEYPTSDGQPMAETTLHRKVMNDLIGSLERRYEDVPDVWSGAISSSAMREVTLPPSSHRTSCWRRASPNGTAPTISSGRRRFRAWWWRSRRGRPAGKIRVRRSCFTNGWELKSSFSSILMESTCGLGFRVSGGGEWGRA